MPRRQVSRSVPVKGLGQVRCARGGRLGREVLYSRGPGCRPSRVGFPGLRVEFVPVRFGREGSSSRGHGFRLSRVDFPDRRVEFVPVRFGREVSSSRGPGFRPSLEGRLRPWKVGFHFRFGRGNRRSAHRSRATSTSPCYP